MFTSGAVFLYYTVWIIVLPFVHEDYLPLVER